LKLHEYQAKEILAKYGIPVPPGKVAFTPEEAREIAREIGKQVVIRSTSGAGARRAASSWRVAPPRPRRSRRRSSA